LAIRDVIDRYAIGLDLREWETVRSCFTADCHADYERFGSWTEREPFVASLDVIHRDVGRTLHRIANHQIKVHGDRAIATSYLDALLQVRKGDHDLLHVVGRYLDEVIRTEDGWRISDRRVETFLRRWESLKA
jgi:3-phenylpropionate/cinnamic acid dioxygenase small subunit